MSLEAYARGHYVWGTTSRGVMSVYRMGEREGRERGGGGKADVNHGEGRGNSCRELGRRWEGGGLLPQNSI